MVSSKLLISSIRPINRTLTGTTTSGQSGPESNGNEGVVQILQSPKIAALISDSSVS